jgi:chromosome segregation ATPase
MLKTLLDESTFQTARLSRTVSELEPMAERLKSQIATLQAAVEAEREAKEKAAIDRVEGLEVLRAELRATTAKLEAATQRAETQEKMLNTARQNYREKLEELRAVERSVIDLTMQLANMTRRAETAEAEKSALHIRVADLETAERSFDLRYEEVSKALTEKETALLLARDQITFESSRLEEAQRMARLERARYEADMVEMARLLDKERVDRTVLEGALLSNRRRHIQRGTEEEASEAVAETVQETITELVDEESNSSSPALLVDDADSGAVILEFERGPASVTLENTVAADQLSETRSPSAPMAS